jgi:hypothetical protein
MRPQKRTKDGRPINRIGQRLMVASVARETGFEAQELLNLEEACRCIHGTKELLHQLTGAGVIAVIQAQSGEGARLYCRGDCLKVALSLFGIDHEATVLPMEAVSK